MLLDHRDVVATSSRCLDGSASDAPMLPVLAHERQRRWEAVLAHRQRLRRVAKARCSVPADVEDCVQEAMVRVVAMPHVDLDRVGGLLTAVVANVAADAHRHAGRSSRLKAKIGNTETSLPGVDESLCDVYEARWLDQHVRALPHRDRQVLALRAEGMSVTEAAEALGITYKAAEGAYTRARRALRLAWRSNQAE
jgi:RNA polymerase sigma factor (sigma-70 family)